MWLNVKKSNNGPSSSDAFEQAFIEGDDEVHDDNGDVDDGGGDDNDVDDGGGDGVVVKEGITFPLDSSICPAFTSRSIVSSWRLSFASKIWSKQISSQEKKTIVTCPLSKLIS